MKFNCNGKDYEVGCIHLTSGDKKPNFIERMKETKQLFTEYTVKDCSFIAGDFNEPLTKDSELLRAFIEAKFKVNEEMWKKLEENTCDKMRSALQYQVNKMKKADRSTKDAILGSEKANISLESYEVV